MPRCVHAGGCTAHCPLTSARCAHNPRDCACCTAHSPKPCPLLHTLPLRPAQGHERVCVPLHLQVSSVSPTALRLIEAAGGSVTRVYYTPLGLRALLKVCCFCFCGGAGRQAGEAGASSTTNAAVRVAAQQPAASVVLCSRRHVSPRSPAGP